MARRMHRAALGSIVVVALASAGCRSNEPVPPPIPQGPVTSLEMPEGVPLPEIPKGNEPDLVERVVFHRAMYARSLRALRDHYATRGENTKRIWAEDELRQVLAIKPYSYILEAVPVLTSQPEASIEAADSLYNEAVEMLQQATGDGGKVGRKQLKRSLDLFQDVVARYPASDKAAPAAYFIGLIHDQYYRNDEQIALAWYERAWQWNPQLPMPARFNAARIYDTRLKDRTRALEMYRQVLAHETFNQANVDVATRRLVELTTRGEDRAAAALKAPRMQQYE